MKRIWLRCMNPVPLEMRPDLHAAGLCQTDARHWSVPLDGSEETKARLRKAGVVFDQVDEPGKDERRMHPAMFHLPGTAELAEAEAREEARVRWRNSRTETGGPR